MEVWRCEPSEEVVYVCFPGSDMAVDLNQCPMGLITSDMGIVFKLFDEYQAGRPIFKNAGYMELPSRLLEAFAVITHYMTEAAEHT